FAPMRTISCACMKRFSKIFSVMMEVPSACVARAMYCACMSVGKPGYSSVTMSAAFRGPSPITRTASVVCAVLTPTSCSFCKSAPRWRGSQPAMLRSPPVTSQAFGLCLDVAVFLVNRGAKSFQSLDVQVDRPRANGATAGQRHASSSATRHQRPKHQRRSPHRLHQLVGSFRRNQRAAADCGAMLSPSVTKFYVRAHFRQQLTSGLNVAHLRNVFQDNGLFCEQGSGHSG